MSATLPAKCATPTNTWVKMSGQSIYVDPGAGPAARACLNDVGDAIILVDEEEEVYVCGEKRKAVRFILPEWYPPWRVRSVRDGVIEAMRVAFGFTRVREVEAPPSCTISRRDHLGILTSSSTAH